MDWDDPAVKAYLKNFRDNVLPHIAESTVTGILISNSKPDSKLCLEIGAAVLLDKPIIAICTDRAKCSQQLARIAVAVVEVDDISTEQGQEKAKAAINRVLEGMA